MDSVRGSGMLNEASLYLRSMRLNTLRDLDLIVKMATKGKAPSPFKRAIPRVEEVHSLFRLIREAKGK
jgi:hypothetical protein